MKTTFKINEPVTLLKGWQSNEYFPDNVHQFALKLDENQRKDIVKAISIMEQNPMIQGIELDCPCPDFQNEEGLALTGFDEYIADVSYLRVSKYKDVHVFTQSKYDSTTQVESEGFRLDDQLSIIRYDN